jgi:ATP-dependent Zn protease
MYMADFKEKPDVPRPGKEMNKRGGKRMPPVPPLPKMPRGDSFWVNLASSIFILLLLASAYTYFMGADKKPVDIPISQLSTDISGGLVTSIEVDGDNLKIIYNDKSEKTSKKEPDSSLTQTLTNYGVSKEALAKVSINIKRQSSWQFWLSALAPFLAPLLLIAFFIWYLTRLRDAGVLLRPIEAPPYRPQRRNLARDL